MVEGLSTKMASVGEEEEEEAAVVEGKKSVSSSLTSDASPVGLGAAVKVGVMMEGGDDL